MAGSCNVLMIYPKFNPRSFWSYDGACELLGAKYPAAPLGLITLAALLPQSWDIRLVNLNTEELDPAELDWADMVMTGGMLAQRPDCLRLIELAQDRGKPVVVGGPDVTSSPQAYEAADIRVLGEAENIIEDFIAAWRRGARDGLFESPKFQVDITKTPIPRFDLLKNGALHLSDGAVLARLPVHVRVLRHHRALRPRSAHQGAGADAGRARPPVRAWLAWASRFCRRQSDRQQEGDEGVPPASDRMAKETSIPVHAFDRSLAEPCRRSAIAGVVEAGQFFCGFCQHRVGG